MMEMIEPVELKRYVGELDPSYRFVEDLAVMALQSENRSNRTFAIRALDDIFLNNLLSGSAVDNQLFVNIKHRGENLPIYVCDLNPKYSDYKGRTYSFRVR